LLSDLIKPIDQAPPQSGPALFLEFARRGKPGGWRYPIVILVGLVLWILLGVVGLLAVLAATGNFRPETLKSLTDPRQTGPYFTLIGVTFGALLLGIWAASRVIQGKGFGDIIGRWRWTLMAKGFGLWFGVLVLSALADFLWRPKGFSLSPDARAPLFMLWVTPALAVQTFAEEFVFRGVITQGLVRAIKRPWLVCLVSGLIFGSAHIPNGPIQAASATVFGMVLTFLALETGGLALGWGLHLINNLFGGMVVVSSSDVFNGAPGLFHQNTPGLDGFDLAFTVAALLVAVWVLRRWAPLPTEDPELDVGAYFS
jgi:membrane protease YdiL (CAAX protease family)